MCLDLYGWDIHCGDHDEVTRARRAFGADRKRLDAACEAERE